MNRKQVVKIMMAIRRAVSEARHDGYEAGFAHGKGKPADMQSVDEVTSPAWLALFQIWSETNKP